MRLVRSNHVGRDDPDDAMIQRAPSQEHNQRHII